MKTKIFLIYQRLKLHGKPPSFFAIFVALAYCEPHSPPKYKKIFFEKKSHHFQNSAGLGKSAFYQLYQNVNQVVSVLFLPQKKSDSP